MLLTTQANDPRLPKGASTEKSALDLELATVAELKTSLLAAPLKGTSRKTILGGDPGMVVCTIWLKCGVKNCSG